MILQDLGCESGAYVRSDRADGAYYFTATYNFCSRKACDFDRKHEVDFKLCVRLERFFRLEKETRAAYVFGCAFAPALLADRAIAQGKVKVEALRTERR